MTRLRPFFLFEPEERLLRAEPTRRTAMAGPAATRRVWRERRRRRAVGRGECVRLGNIFAVGLGRVVKGV